MPTYGYKCEKCQTTFEVFQKVNDSPIEVCPECAGRTTRVFYPVGIIFKGPGFHITDYCRPKESEQEKSKSSEAKKKPTESAKEMKGNDKAS